MGHGTLKDIPVSHTKVSQSIRQWDSGDCKDVQNSGGFGCGSEGANSGSVGLSIYQWNSVGSNVSSVGRGRSLLGSSQPLPISRATKPSQSLQFPSPSPATSSSNVHKISQSFLAPHHLGCASTCDNPINNYNFFGESHTSNQNNTINFHSLNNTNIKSNVSNINKEDNVLRNSYGGRQSAKVPVGVHARSADSLLRKNKQLRPSRINYNKHRADQNNPTTQTARKYVTNITTHNNISPPHNNNNPPDQTPNNSLDSNINSDPSRSFRRSPGQAELKWARKQLKATSNGSRPNSHVGSLEDMERYCVSKKKHTKSHKKSRSFSDTIMHSDRISLSMPNTEEDIKRRGPVFGKSLEQLMSYQKTSTLTIPEVFIFLTSNIEKLGGFKEVGLFRISGANDETEKIRRRLDRGNYSSKGLVDPHVFACILKSILTSLPNSLIPSHYYRNCIAVAKEPRKCIELIEEIPQINQNILNFLLGWIQMHILSVEGQQATRMNANSLGMVLGPCLLREPPFNEALDVTKTIHLQMQFIQNIIIYYGFKEDKDIPAHYHPPRNCASLYNVSPQIATGAPVNFNKTKLLKQKK
eukprot:CAMPEP_0174269528 /NCGR_PEP_ID=MMETSP0439-20130205/41371_1 /TAXON_ID=0 /ORGANISM="Stereomyxa ramosa, Strain Chinc5" /LENGTH=582 /DNA_ID=CAMNT_0015358361 /DNA_START=115 /DNA_END=1860 /DNA_ORIENTATION=+